MSESKTAPEAPAPALDPKQTATAEWWMKKLNEKANDIRTEVGNFLNESEDHFIDNIQKRLNSMTAKPADPEEFPLQSPSIDQLIKAFVAMQAELKDPEKNRTVEKKYWNKEIQEYVAKTYDYADLQAGLLAFRSVGPKHGLALKFALKPWTATHMMLVAQITHTSTQWLRSYWPIPANGGAQDKGSELTYGKRYSLDALVAMAGEEDDDGAGAQAAAQAPKNPPKEKNQNKQAPPAGGSKPPSQAPFGSATAAAEPPKKEVEPDLEMIPDDMTQVARIIFQTGSFKDLTIHQVWATKRAAAIATALEVAKAKAKGAKVPNKFLALVDYGLVKKFIEPDFASHA